MYSHPVEHLEQREIFPKRELSRMIPADSEESIIQQAAAVLAASEAAANPPQPADSAESIIAKAAAVLAASEAAAKPPQPPAPPTPVVPPIIASRNFQARYGGLFGTAVIDFKGEHVSWSAPVRTVRNNCSGYFHHIGSILTEN
jgi:hypothetical protein